MHASCSGASLIPSLLSSAAVLLVAPPIVSHHYCECRNGELGMSVTSRWMSLIYSFKCQVQHCSNVPGLQVVRSAITGTQLQHLCGGKTMMGRQYTVRAFFFTNETELYLYSFSIDATWATLPIDTKTGKVQLSPLLECAISPPHFSYSIDVCIQNLCTQVTVRST